MDRDDKQLIMDFLNTFTSEGGKRVLEKLSEKCRENVATYVANDTHHTAYFEGMRSVIIYIRLMLAKNPNVVKQKEARS